MVDLSSKKLYLTGIIVYNKSLKKVTAKGLNCNFIFSDEMTDKDKKLMKIKIQNIIDSMSSDDTHTTGYIALKDYFDQIAYYYSFKDWIVFLTLKATEMIQFFARFSEIMIFLRGKMEKTITEDIMLDLIHKQLRADVASFNCEGCDVQNCIPQMTYRNIKLIIEQ